MTMHTTTMECTLKGFLQLLLKHNTDMAYIIFPIYNNPRYAVAIEIQLNVH